MERNKTISSIWVFSEFDPCVVTDGEVLRVHGNDEILEYGLMPKCLIKLMRILQLTYANRDKNIYKWGVEWQATNENI